LVGVPKPEPPPHVVGHQEVDPLASQLAGGAVEAARLGGERDEHRPGLQRRAGRRTRVVEAADEPAQLGDEVRIGGQLEGQALVGPRQLTVSRGGRTEVRDGGRHDEGIEAGPSGRILDEAAEDGPHRRGRLGPDHLDAFGEGHAGHGEHERHPGPAIPGRLGEGGAHRPRAAVADEAHRVDRLGRAAGRDHDVPARQVVAVATQPLDLHPRQTGRTIGRVGPAGRAVPDRPHDGVDDLPELGQATRPDLPEARAPLVGSTIA